MSLHEVNKKKETEKTDCILRLNCVVKIFLCLQFSFPDLNKFQINVWQRNLDEAFVINLPVQVFIKLELFRGQNQLLDIF